MQDRVDVGRLRAALDTERRKKGISWRQLAQQAQISPSLLSRMQNGSKPDLESFAALIQWLKVPAEDFMTSQSVDSREREASSAAFETKFAVLLRAEREFDAEDQKHLLALVESTARFLREKKTSS